jgi:putative phosphoribosyl transferase
MLPFQDGHQVGPESGEEHPGHAEKAEEQRSSPRRFVEIPTDSVVLNGEFVVPGGASSIVLFAQSSAGSHHPRSGFVARALQDSGFGTLAIDLLTEDEEETIGWKLRVRFADLLASRLVQATQWILSQSSRQFEIGYFGTSVGAAAALIAAVRLPENVKAVVSLAGRTDFTQGALADIPAATLLIVGANDPQVLDLNREALDELRCEKRLEVVPGVAHVFDTQGAIERAAELARAWFQEHLGATVIRPGYDRTIQGHRQAMEGRSQEG